LGVSRYADADTLKRAYRKLARQYHPDVNKEPGAEDKFKEIGKAYEALADPETRARYDQFGEAGLGGAAGMPDMGDMGGFADLFETFFNGFGGQNPQGGRTQRRGPQQGDDLRYDLNVDFKDAIFGQQREIKFLIWRHVKSVGEQVQNPAQDPKLVSHVVEVDKVEEATETPLG
jgi:DnaJ-class molecular chaperone with C-terminal Zn finger domain